MTWVGNCGRTVGTEGRVKLMHSRKKNPSDLGGILILGLEGHSNNNEHGSEHQETVLVLNGECLVGLLKCRREVIASATLQPNLVPGVVVVNLGGRYRQGHMGRETGR